MIDYRMNNNCNINTDRSSSVFSPKDFVKYAYPQLDRRKLPRSYIIAYQHATLNHFRRVYKPTSTIKLHRDFVIYLHGDIGFVRIPGIGSPNAVACLEELIALGGKKFLTIGTAGGLRGPGVFLCTKSFRDEGTSYHYVRRGKYAYPDKKLMSQFEKSIKNLGIRMNKCATWTTDATFRETIGKIACFRKKGISTVDMEASALFTVAKYRQARITSAFVVSDIIGSGKWEPHFLEKDVKKQLAGLVDAAVACLS